ncbi:Alpha/Beta hydrolase protein [Zopfochytrium polystomum]|nr:Alpha/Beta hydrolase protein [Zopfochytrium polystomum]
MCRDCRNGRSATATAGPGQPRWRIRGPRTFVPPPPPPPSPPPSRLWAYSALRTPAPSECGPGTETRRLFRVWGPVPSISSVRGEEKEFKTRMAAYYTATVAGAVVAAAAIIIARRTRLARSRAPSGFDLASAGSSLPPTLLPDSTATTTFPTHLPAPMPHFTWSSYGPKSARRVLIFLHGLPGSRLIPVSDLSALCHDHKVRILAIDRPGIGFTPPAASPRAHAPAVVAAVLRLLASEAAAASQIDVVGYSAGAPHALRVASALSRKLHRGSTASPPPPLSTPAAPAPTLVLHLIAPIGFASRPVLAASNPASRTIHALARRAPWLLSLVWFLFGPLLSRGDTYMRAMLDAAPPADRAGLSPDELAGWLATARETWRQGPARGFVREVLAAFGKSAPAGWDGVDVGAEFGAEARRHVRVRFYAAEKDDIAPIVGALEMMRVMGFAGPEDESTVLRRWEQPVGHFSVLRPALNAIVQGEV